MSNRFPSRLTSVPVLICRIFYTESRAVSTNSVGKHSVTGFLHLSVPEPTLLPGAVGPFMIELAGVS